MMSPNQRGQKFVCGPLPIFGITPILISTHDIIKHIFCCPVIPEIAQRDVIHDGDADTYSKVITDRQTYRWKDGRTEKHLKIFL